MALKGEGVQLIFFLNTCKHLMLRRYSWQLSTELYCSTCLDFRRYSCRYSRTKSKLREANIYYEHVSGDTSWNYLCFKRSCSRDDLITGTLSSVSLYESCLVNSKPSLGLLLNTISKSSPMRSFCGISCPKHSCEMSSIKKV